MKNLLVPLLMLCLSAPGFAQADKLGAVGKALVKQTPKVVSANASSKLYKARYQLTSQSINTLQQMYTSQIAEILSKQELESAIRMQLLKQLQEESAAHLLELNLQQEKEYAQWADVLLRERNPNFLPKKDSSIPGLLAISPDVKKYPHITPRFYREWITTIPEYESIPDDFYVLVDAIKKRLSTIEIEMIRQHREFKKIYKQLQECDNNFEMQRFYRKKIVAISRQLVTLSKEAAQHVSDLVYMLNSYPALFKDSLTLLAAKIDLAIPTEFNTYLRAKINIPRMQSQQAKRPVGFYEHKPEVQPKATTFTGINIK